MLILSMLSLLGISFGSLDYDAVLLGGEGAAGLDEALARRDIEVDDADDAADDEADGRRGEAEGAAALEAVVGLVVAAPAQGAARALAEAHGAV